MASHEELGSFDHYLEFIYNLVTKYSVKFLLHYQNSIFDERTNYIRKHPQN